MKLKARFSLVFILFILLVLGISSGTYYLLEQRSQAGEQRFLALATLDKVVSACREAMLERNWISAVNLVSVVQKGDPAILFGDCLDPEGRARAHSDADKIGLTLASRQELISSVQIREKEYNDGQGRLVWEIAKTIELPDGPAGMGRIGYDAAYLKRQIHRRLVGTIHRIVQVSSITLVVALLMALLLSWSLNRPIQALITATRQIKNGNLAYQSLIFRRKDELGELAAEFNSMAKHLAELDEMKNLFVDSITHDLRGPLSILSGYVELFLTMQAASLKKEHVEQIRIMENQVNRLGRYISNLLDYSKIQAGRFFLHPGRLSLGELARSAVSEFSLPARLDEVQLDVRVEEGLPEIEADKEMIQRVLANLISNAIKFTPEGGHVSVEVGREGEGFLRVRVRDTGMGIAPADLEHVFEGFFQAGKAVKSARREGTGLGLTICKKFVEQHGGRIWAESTVNVGTAFTFTLPRRG